MPSIPLDQLQFGLDRIRHRGPDDSRLEFISSDIAFGFVRLAIMDTSPAGMQPMSLEGNGGPILICNGEIYNYRELIEKYNFTMKSSCDCEVLLHLYREFGGGSDAIARICQVIDAEFVFILYDPARKALYAARDFGIRPLFWADTSKGIFFGSEAKSILPFLSVNERVLPFPPRSWWSSQRDSRSVMPYYVLPTGDQPVLTDRVDILERIRTTLISSVSSRLMSDRPVGFFLSGGLDSSLVVAIASRSSLFQSMARTFSIGLIDNDGISRSPDLVAARTVSAFCRTKHTEVTVSFDQAFAAIEEVIRAGETFDTTTIRASVPQYLLAQHIRKTTDIRVLLSGEGADELEYGYLMWHQAPSIQAAQEVSVELCNDLYMYDCLRCDRTTAAFGLEVRVPFLARSFIDLMMSVSPELKMPSLVSSVDSSLASKQREKQLVRDAFQGYLPDEILYRVKAAFSDAVGLSWVDTLKAQIESQISDADFEERAQYSHCPPRTKEELYYRRIFERFYPGQGTLIKDFWRLRWQQTDDPSARYLSCYKQE